ncbi:MAG TPA: CmcI family methyltransferase [Bryobacteraceae bacterium]|nr:CmcI family methyltransferase [Bryobacteraceae bacterium]
MKIIIDTSKASVLIENDAERRELPLFSPEAFSAIERQWMRVGWALDYYHRFLWMGIPILQLPEDLIRLQEAFYLVRPDFVVETGVFCGGSLLFAASICEALRKGRVIGVEKELRDDARQTMATHPLASRISIIEGDSAAPETLQAVRALLGEGDKSVLVVLDSDHSAAHVARELEAYAPLVTPGSCMVVEDGVMKDLADVPGGHPTWVEDNPITAVDAFIKRHPEFRREEARTPYNRSSISISATYWPGGWLWKQ